MGDFNVDSNDTSLKGFCQFYNLKHLINAPTCYQNLMLLINSHCSFQDSCAVEAGLSGLYKMTITVLKTNFKNKGPKIVTYRKYKNYFNDIFRQLIFNEFAKIQVCSEVPVKTLD